MDRCRQKATLLLFWDYDTQWGADRSRGPGGPKNWGWHEIENTERLLELHAQYDIKACFAVVGAAALPGELPYHTPEQIRRIHAAGHEIASHSFSHDWLPGLPFSELLETLYRSRDALEQCIGAPVVTFVPPYNQPFRYPEKYAPAFSERRIAGKDAVTIPTLCTALRKTGYKFARISYFPWPEYVMMRLFRWRPRRLSRLEAIAGITCVRLNTPCGFAKPSLLMLEHGAAAGQGILVVYAHPHSLYSDGPQHERYLIPFFERISELRRQGKLQVTLPSDLIGNGHL